MFQHSLAGKLKTGVLRFLIDDHHVGSDLDGEAPDDRFGHSVSLSANGKLLAIGATGNDDNCFLSWVYFVK